MQVDAFLWGNPQTALSAVHFRVPSSAASSGKGLSFVLQTNSSLQYFKGQYTDPNTHVLLPLQVAVEAGIARLAVNGEQRGAPPHTCMHERLARAHARCTCPCILNACGVMRLPVTPPVCIHACACAPKLGLACRTAGPSSSSPPGQEQRLVFG